MRQLAVDLRVAAGTVARAYSALETARLLTTSRGSGTRVRPDQKLGAESRSSARRFVQAQRRDGVSLDDALSAVRRVGALTIQTHLANRSCGLRTSLTARYTISRWPRMFWSRAGQGSITGLGPPLSEWPRQGQLAG